jgi:hypothetical protein
MNFPFPTLKAFASLARQLANAFSVAESLLYAFPGLSQAPTLG